ncbi:PAS domain-containing protein [Roseisalinus antarcticus]|uniref:Aerotaxis receptor n=1 Tax=Roseisalinus antarcticus TaxID=254357 RepID=A0A1Y5S5T8_9RHOB|nr:PAS domain-containing protein [Roseisalinus antarcticus]SLN33182.1 Aerotaxis receptor [Roseisalinus antarcticus]
MTALTDTSDFADRTRMTAGEVPFAVEELFFSRTDTRGVILNGNEVFCRVSGFDADEIIGAPHKIVRHPDMPKAVFQLVWDRIRAGKPVGAYIKNRAKDGRYYWVYAVVSPIEGGYVSIRLKPSAKLLRVAQTLYAAQRRRETEDGIGAEQSLAELRMALAREGHASYATFEAEALALEMKQRCAEIGQAADSRMDRFLAMSRAIQQVGAETEEMMKAFEAIRTIPLNMRILASRLENAGGPISAISVNYGSMSDEMAAWVKTFIHGDDSAFSRIRDAIVSGLFCNGISQLSSEMIRFFKEEVDGDTGEETTGELEMLSDLCDHAIDRSKVELKKTELEAGRLSRSVLDMKRYITGLSSTRMMCKIESATLSKSGETLVGIVDQLDASQDGIEERLAKISELNHQVQAHTAMLRASSA